MSISANIPAPMGTTYTDQVDHSLVGMTNQEKVTKKEQPKPESFLKATVWKVAQFTLAGLSIAAAVLIAAQGEPLRANKRECPETFNEFLRVAFSAMPQIQQARPEDYGDVITDRPVQEIDVKFMKNLKLKDMAFDVPGGPKFNIRNTKTQEIMDFSNRGSTTVGELRGVILRDKLNEYAAKNPEMSLYDAIAKIITSEDSETYKALKSGFVEIYHCGNANTFDKFYDALNNQMKKRTLDINKPQDVQLARKMFEALKV